MEITGIGICWEGAWDKKGEAGRHEDQMKIPSPTKVKQSSVGDRQMFRSPPKIARRRKSMRNGGDNNWLSWMKKYKEVVVVEAVSSSCEYDQMNMNMNLASASPYYKGLTDQSLAISRPPPPPPPVPPPPPLLLSPAGYSPYYKGLTDFSLVIHTPHSHHTPAAPNNSSSSLISSSSYASSPYYRGLIDYSLALALHPPPNSPSSLKHPPCHHSGDHITTDQGKPLSVVVVNESSSEPTFQEIFDFDHASVAVQVEVEVEVEGGKPLSVYESSQAVLQDDEDDDDVEIEQEKKGILVPELETTDPVLPENGDLNLEEMQEEKRDLVEQYINIITEKTDLEDYDLGTGEETQFCGHKLKLKEEGKVQPEEEEEYLWATKYQPKTLAEFICNRDKALQLKALVNSILVSFYYSIPSVNLQENIN